MKRNKTTSFSPLYLIAGVIIGSIFVYKNNDMNIHYNYAKRAYLGETVIVSIQPIKNRIIDDLTNAIEIDPTTFNYPLPPHQEKSIIDIYPNGDIFLHTQHNQFVLFRIHYDADAQRTPPISPITWDCLGAPIKTMLTECLPPNTTIK